MKRFFPCLILLSLLLATGCGKDDDNGGCVRQDWVGDYTGTLECPNGDPEAVNFSIEIGTLDGNIRFVEPANRMALPENDFAVTGCNVTNARYDINWLGGPVETIWSGSLQGNSLSVDIDVNLLGICKIRATR